MVANVSLLSHLLEIVQNLQLKYIILIGKPSEKDEICRDNLKKLGIKLITFDDVLADVSKIYFIVQNFILKFF